MVKQTDKPSDAVSVTAAEIIRNFGQWQQRALETPLAVTHHGRARVMLIGVDTYERLAARRPPSPADQSTELRQFAENAAEGFFAYDADLRVTEINQVAANYLGRPRSAVIGTAMDGPEWGAGNPYVASVMRRVLTTGEAAQYEADSTLFPGRRISLRTFPFRGGIATLFTNVTERERLRAGGEKGRATRRAIQRTGRIAVARLDLSGRIMWVDQVFTDLTGFTAIDLQAVRLINCVVPQDRRQTDQFFNEIGAQAKSGVTIAGVIVKSGETRRMKLAGVPLLRQFAPSGLVLMIAPAPG